MKTTNRFDGQTEKIDNYIDNYSKIKGMFLTHGSPEGQIEANMAFWIFFLNPKNKEEWESEESFSEFIDKPDFKLLETLLIWIEKRNPATNELSRFYHEKALALLEGFTSDRVINLKDITTGKRYLDNETYFEVDRKIVMPDNKTHLMTFLEQVFYNKYMEIDLNRIQDSFYIERGADYSLHVKEIKEMFSNKH